MVESRRRVVLGVLLHGRRDEQSRIAVYGIRHVGQREERQIRQDRFIYMCRWVRVRSGVGTADRKWGPVHNGDRRLPVWPDPAGRGGWDNQLHTIQPLDLTDGFEIPKDKRLLILY